MNSLEELLLKYGYTAKGYGYHRVSKHYTHWITQYPDSIQMYAYYTSDPEMKKVYDTGMIKIYDDQLIQLINIFTKNHN